MIANKRNGESAQRPATAVAGESRHSAPPRPHRRGVCAAPARTLFVLLGILLASHAGRTVAQERPLQFIHALQQRRLGDTAADYLEMLAKRGAMPPEVRDVWDLEMAKCLRIAADDAFDADERQRLLDQSLRHLSKFLEQRPDHPAAADAAIILGNSLFDRALGALRSAQQAKGADPKLIEQRMADGRAQLDAARVEFERAEKRLAARLAALPPVPKPPVKKERIAEALAAKAEAKANVEQARLAVAKIDYYLAQTYADADEPRRTAALEKAGQAFDDIFQRNRHNRRIGAAAHLWHGKTAEQLGDLQLALDIFDEVLVQAPEAGEQDVSRDEEATFAEAECLRMAILAKQNPQQFLAEAKSWLQLRQRSRQTEGYQAVALGMAKTLLSLAAKATGGEKKKIAAEAVRVLTDMSKVRSSHRQEAVLLRRDALRAAGNPETETATFDEAVAAGDAALAAADWQQAENAYRKALDLAAKRNPKDADELVAVREALARARLGTLCDMFNQGKYQECIDGLRAIAFEDSAKKTVRAGSDAAVRASAVALTAALRLYAAAAPDRKPAALRKLVELADLIESHWPDRPEADDARMARAQVKLSAGRLREAVAVLDRVNPKSPRYPQAMLLAGQAFAALAELENSKPAGARSPDRIAADRAEAVERLEAGRTVLRRQVLPERPAPNFLADTELLLADIRRAGGELQQAAAVYQSQIDAVKTQRRRELDETTLRVFLGALRTYMALGDLDKAADAADTLIELGPDTQPVNAMLVDFAKRVDAERKRTAASAGAGNEAQREAARSRSAAIEKLLGKILVKLAQRREMPPAGTVFLGDALAAVGMTDEAVREYQAALAHAPSEPAAAAKTVPHVRAALVGLLRAQGQFEEALKQVEQLIASNPRALEPLMEKGRILEGWAEKEPARFDEAVAHWVRLRTQLQPLRPKPPEYYDVMYAVARCLVRGAEAAGDRTATISMAHRGQQVLQAALDYNPALNGPDAVARYQALMARAIALQGQSSDAKGGKNP
jgi:tetratricopeptide (TPR) repeat protein